MLEAKIWFCYSNKWFYRGCRFAFAEGVIIFGLWKFSQNVGNYIWKLSTSHFPTIWEVQKVLRAKMCFFAISLVCATSHPSIFRLKISKIFFQCEVQKFLNWRRNTFDKLLGVPVSIEVATAKIRNFRCEDGTIFKMIIILAMKNTVFARSTFWRSQTPKHAN